MNTKKNEPKISLPKMVMRDNVSTCGIEREDESLVAIVFNQPHMRTIANLFVAAPEMRDVLKMVLDALKFHHPDMHYSISEIERVLRKADGKI